MATKKGVWNLQQVRDKSLQNNWNYTNSVGPFTLWVWGTNNFPSNRSGMLGLNDIANRSSPTQLPGTTWNKIAGGNTGTLATKTDGTLWAWGANKVYGELGLNQSAPTMASSPVQIPGTDWSKPYINYYQGAAVKTNGELWVWGYGEEGALGVNSRTNYSSPVQVPGTNWSTEYGHFVGSSNNATYAIRTDGTLWAWGINRQNGQLGLNSLQDKSSPTQIGSATNWSWVKGSNNVILAVNTDGELWTWGADNYGQLGLSQQGAKISSPVQVPGTTWSQIGGNATTITALKTDGTLWSWGFNGDLLGLGDSTNRSSPTQIGTDTSWSGVVYGHVGAMKSNGSIWVWGGNGSGRLGLNQPTGTEYFSPVQLPGNYDYFVSGNGKGMFATRPI
jgi:alpha-tubulin suppressor-like RCC1 family protein